MCCWPSSGATCPYTTAAGRPIRGSSRCDHRAESGHLERKKESDREKDRRESRKYIGGESFCEGDYKFSACRFTPRWPTGARAAGVPSAAAAGFVGAAAADLHGLRAPPAVPSGEALPRLATKVGRRERPSRLGLRAPHPVPRRNSWPKTFRRSFVKDLQGVQGLAQEWGNQAPKGAGREPGASVAACPIREGHIALAAADPAADTSWKSWQSRASLRVVPS